MLEEAARKPRVILRHCPDYDVDRIEQIIGEGLDLLELRPHGKTLVKPNLVATGEQFPHAYTRTEFTEGVLRALKTRATADTTEISVGERCGITVPTRYAYKGADYYKMADRVGGVNLYHFDEEPQVRISLHHDERLRDYFYTPKPVAEADFFVNCPKFKAHPWSVVTFSMKNYIGIQDDRHRLIDHDHKLENKVADLQYIVQPQFIAIDAVIAGEGRMLTPIPYDLKLIIMGENQAAIDAVCCAIIGVDPREVGHLRLAHERGFGPIDLEHIELHGDVRLEEAQERAASFQVGLIRVEDYFADTNIRAYAGPPPSADSDYCWGGCPGAMEEAIEVLRLYDAATDEKMPPVHIVFGAYDGEIPAKEGEKVIFIGDCATWKGELRGQMVDLQSLYRDRSTLEPLAAKHDDIFAKMVKVPVSMFQARNEPVVRLRGCPVSVAEQILTLVVVGGLKNPYLDPRIAPSFVSSYLSWRTRYVMSRVFGTPYNEAGEAKRGKARPAQNIPATV